MKAWILAVSSLISTVAYGADCPDFSGQFKSETGASVYRIDQADCSRITLVFSDETATHAPYSLEMDGVRRPTNFETYRRSYFQNGSLVSESWSAPSGGTMVRPKILWTLEARDEGTFLVQRELSPTAGERNELFKKLP